MNFLQHSASSSTFRHFSQAQARVAEENSVAVSLQFTIHFQIAKIKTRTIIIFIITT